MEDKKEDNKEEKKAAYQANVKEYQTKEEDGKTTYLDDETNEWVSKGEIKKREKQRATKAKQEEKKKTQSKAPGKKQEEEKDPTKYKENRYEWLNQRRIAGENPYPHKFHRTHMINEFVAEFDTKCADNDVFFEDVVLSVTGRVESIRN